MTSLTTRIGFELELLAPAGSDRRTLADRIAHDHDGHVEQVFHTDSEPSLVPGMGHFWHLTPGFTVRDRDGAELATLVDDITITEDLRQAQAQQPAQQRAPRPLDHSYRVLSDDARLLRLVADRTDPDTPFDRVLDTVADVFRVTVETIGTVRRLRDRTGASIAMATALASGRERPCEIVTPPITADHQTTLEALLRPARELGFTVPVEAAVHLHVDGAPFRTAAALGNLVRLFGHWRGALRAALGTNPACTRLGEVPPGLIRFVDGPASGDTTGADAWRRLQAAAADAGLTKYSDVNLTALLTDHPVRDTVEVRILPGSLTGADVTERARLVEGLLARCRRDEPIPRPTSDDPATAAGALRALAGFIPLAERDERTGR